jgi:glutamate racemase
MRIGVFDSGLGGLVVAQAIMARLPQYDYLYLGDTRRVPYGGRSQETIHEFTSEALNYLFAQNCQLIILACNTASAEALRKSQQEYLPRYYPDRRVLGVIIPTAEEVFSVHRPRRVGVLATKSTVESNAYARELNRQCPNVEVAQLAAPLLVPLLENDGLPYLEPILKDYLAKLKDIEALVLGCTHYALIKEDVRAAVSVPVYSSDEIVPTKLADYLHRHPEIEAKLGRNGERLYHLTDLSEHYHSFVSLINQTPIAFEKVTL